MTKPISQKARMLAGELYIADDPELNAANLRAQNILATFNATPADAAYERRALLTDLFAPGVHIYTATHPIDAKERRSGAESALPVSIGDGVWLGGCAIVCPGITIGENTVVGAGSVVTRDLPPNVLAAGNPCRVIRQLC